MVTCLMPNDLCAIEKYCTSESLHVTRNCLVGLFGIAHFFEANTRTLGIEVGCCPDIAFRAEQGRPVKCASRFSNLTTMRIDLTRRTALQTVQTYEAR